MENEANEELFGFGIPDGSEPLDANLSELIVGKIGILVRNLVETTIDAGGVYYEYDSILDRDVELPNTKNQINHISSVITPYVVYVADTYIKNFYGDSIRVFSFSKNVIYENYSILTFNVNRATQQNLSILLLFIITAFNDHFNSGGRNKVVLNKLTSILEYEG